MWLVRELFSGNSEQSGYVLGSDKQFAVLDTLVDSLSCPVGLIDSVTGKEQVVYLCRDNVRQFVKSNEIYGSFALQDSAHYRSGLLMVIDDLSWKFLDYVDDVSIVTEERDIRGRGHGCDMTTVTHVDDLKSVFQVRFNRTRAAYYATLLSLCCYFEDGWVGDTFYLNSRQGLGAMIRGEAHPLYKVTFKDATKARAFIGKALFSGQKYMARYLDSLTRKPVRL